MPKNRTKATVEITAEDKTSRALKAMERKFSAATKRLKKTGRAMTAAVTLPAVIFGASAFNEFRQFEAEMAKVAAVSGATGEEFKALEKNAKDLGAATRFSAAEVSGLQLEYSKLGFNATEITKVTKATLALAQASGSDLAQSATVAGSTLRAFGIDAADTSRVTDVMALSFSTSALDLEKFQESMKLVAPVSRAAGVSLENTTGLLAALADNGISGSNAGTALRRILNVLGKDGRPINDVLAELGETNLDLAKAEKLVGKNAQSALLILAKNAKRAKELTKQYEGAEGAAQQMADIMSNTADGALARLSSAFSALQIQVGGILAKALLPIIDAIGPVLAKFGEMDETIQLVVVGVAALAAAIGPVLIVLGSLVSGIGAVAGVLGAVSFAPIIAGVVAVGGVFAILVRYWGQVKQATISFVNFLVSSFNAWRDRNSATLAQIGEAWNVIKDSAVRIFGVVVAKIQEVIVWLDNFLEPIGGLQGAWEIFGEIVSRVWDNLTTVIGGAFDIIAAVFSNLADVMEGNKTLWEGLRDIISTVLTTIKDVFFKIFGEIIAYLKTLPDKLLELGRNIIEGLLKGLKEKAQQVIDFVKDIGESIKDTFGWVMDMNSPSKVFIGYGRNITAGLAIGIASSAGAAESESEALARKVIAGYERGIGSDPFSLPGAQGPDFSSVIGAGGNFGGGFGEIEIPGAKEMDATRAFYDERLSLLREKGLEETRVAKEIEGQKTKALGQMRQQQLAGYGQTFDSILSLTEQFGGKQSGAYKALFAVSKAFAVAESAVAIQTSIAQAAARGWPQNIGLIAQAIAQGSQIISTIKGTQPSFLGGGFTGYGARTGGVDGRGGFNAVLHPNEYVVDQKKGQGVGGGNVINITIYGDPNPSVVADIKEEAANFAVGKVVNIQQRKGSRAAAISPQTR